MRRALTSTLPEVYDKAVENFNAFCGNGWLVQDNSEHYYIYAQTMNGRTQYGIVVAANVADYMEGRIKSMSLPDVIKKRIA